MYKNKKNKYFLHHSQLSYTILHKFIPIIRITNIIIMIYNRFSIEEIDCRRV